MKKSTINTYSGHIRNGEYEPERLISTVETEYDDVGRMLSRTFVDFDEEGKVERSFATIRRLDERGYFIYEDFDADGKILGYDIKDINGNTIESKSHYGQMFYSRYDENGNEVEIYSHDKEGVFLYRSRYEYDSEGRLIRSMHENESPCTCIYHYSKDVMGNIVRTLESDRDDYISSGVYHKDSSKVLERKDELFEDEFVTCLRYFNQSGNQICCSSWHDDDMIQVSQIDHIKYDERGNWIMRVSPTLNRVLCEDDPELSSELNDSCYISIRVIEYFDYLSFASEF